MINRLAKLLNSNLSAIKIKMKEGTVSSFDSSAIKKNELIRGIFFIAALVIIAIGIIIAKGPSRYTFNWSWLEHILGTGYYGFPNFREVFTGGIIALAGLVIAGVLARKILPDSLSMLQAPCPHLKRDFIAWGSGFIGIISQAILYWHLVSSEYSHWDIVLFLSGLVLIGFSVHRFSYKLKQNRLFHRLDILLLLVIFSFAILINSIGLTDWQFAGIGDEGAFFDRARAIEHGSPWNFFDLHGAFGAHPILDSAYAALALKIFGSNVFGWRLGEVIITAASAALMYLLVALLLGRFAGFSAGILLGSSHYLFAFNRTGYNHIHPIFYAILAILMLALAWRTQKPVFTFATGIAIGWCLYTAPFSMLTFVILAAILAIEFIQHPNLEYLKACVLIVFGFLLVITPAFIENSPGQSIDLIARHSPLNLKDEAVNKKIDFWFNYEGILASFLVFIVNPKWHDHYINDPLIDTITAVFLIAGLGICVFRFNKKIERVALAWFILSVIIIQISNDTHGIKLTRALYALPAIFFVAAIAIANLDAILQKRLRLQAFISHTIILCFLIFVPILNLNYAMSAYEPVHQLYGWNTFPLKYLQSYPDQHILRIAESPSKHELPFQNAYMQIWFPWYAKRYSYSNLSEFNASSWQYNWPVIIVESENIVNNVSAKLPHQYKQFRDCDIAEKCNAWYFLPMNGKAEN